MPSMYIQEKNFMAAVQVAVDENKTNPGKDVTPGDVINRILSDHFKGGSKG